MRTCTICGASKSDKEFYANRRQCRSCYNRPRPRGPKPAAVPVTPPRAQWANLEAFDQELALETAQSAPPAAGRVEIVDEVLTHVQEHRLKVKNAQLLAQIKALTVELSDARAMEDLVSEVRDMPPVPGIEPRERKSGIAEATPLVLASDWHIEEEVRPEQVAGRNRYNLDISKHRMERFFEAVRWGVDHNRQAFKIRDLVMWLGGDIITNYLHDDNIESNLLSPVEAIAYADTSITAGINFLLEDREIEQYVFVCNDGNHGRLTHKMRSATRIESSIEWLLYTMLASKFKHEPRVKFILPTSSQTYYDVYGRTIRFTHGDTCKYGGGVGGITIPIYKAMARWDTVRRADLTCMGHFHQRTSLSDLIINGSLIGYSPYARDIGARFEPPAQEFSILEPRRFRGLSMPLWVSEREDDQG